MTANKGLYRLTNEVAASSQYGVHILGYNKHSKKLQCYYLRSQFIVCVSRGADISRSKIIIFSGFVNLNNIRKIEKHNISENVYNSLQATLGSTSSNPVASNILRSNGSPEVSPSITVRE